jgi:hypothetical protein
MAYRLSLRTAALAGAVLVHGLGAEAQAADKVRVSSLSDVAFGSLVALSDVSIARDVCVYSTALSGAYAVIASGSGSGGAFELASGSDRLAYDVQWAQAAGQASGSALQAGVASQPFFSGAVQQVCNSGPASTAALVLRMKASDVAAARAGSYSGVLTLTIVPG